MSEEGRFGEFLLFLLKAALFIVALRVLLYFLGLTQYIPVIDDILNFLYDLVIRLGKALAPLVDKIPGL